MLMQLTVYDIPAVQEYLGQLRGRGAGVATAGSFNPQSFISVSTLFDSISQYWNKVEDHYDSVITLGGANANRELVSGFNNAKQAVDRFKEVSKNQLIDPDSPTISGSDYFKSGTDAIVNVAKLYQASVNAYNDHLLIYRAEINNHLIFVMSVFFILVAFGIYLFMALKQSLDKNVHTTQDMAASLEKGMLNGPISK